MAEHKLAEQSAKKSSQHSPVQRQTKKASGSMLTDNREASVVQKKPNKTGLPDHLKAGMENVSGMSLDNVKVHYNSPKPAQVQAHAFAQGSDIHLASGQEKHLPHELGHVVQQMQGRVKPTTTVAGTKVNDDKSLEHEADKMGAAAATHHTQATNNKPLQKVALSSSQIQRQPIQRVTKPDSSSPEAATEWITKNRAELRSTQMRRNAFDPLLQELNENKKYWNDYWSAWQPAVADLQSKIEARLTKVKIVETFIETVREKRALTASKLAPLAALNGDFEPNSWLYSYATDEQKADITSIHTHLAPVEAELRALEAGFTQKVTQLEATDFATRTLASIRGDVATYYSRPFIPDLKSTKLQAAQTLMPTLQARARTEIGAMLTAKKNAPADKLDVSDVNAVRDELYNQKVRKNTLEARITAALALQHAPSKDIWLRKVLNLAPAKGGVYMRNIASIGGVNSHKTRYENSISKNPSVKTAAAALEEDLLGSGDTAFHVTVDTSNPSNKQPHAYRKGVVRLRWEENEMDFPGKTQGEVFNALRDARNTQVDNAEAAIDKTRGNKGENLQRGAVKDTLEGR